MEIDLIERKPVVGSSDNRMDERGDLCNYIDPSNGVPLSALTGPIGVESSASKPPEASNNDSLESITPIGHRTDEAFSSLLNEITLPALRAEVETKSPGQWEPKELRPRHREMMRRILEGATYIEIAEEMGISTQSVMLVCNSAIFKEELKALDDDLNLNVQRRAEELSNEALDKLKVLMRRAKSESLQASCAERVLGIAGYSKIEKKQVSIVSGEDVIRELNRRRRELAGLSQQSAGSNLGATVEAEVSD